uniref:Pentatricopeptide repeat-containing protein n=1 Tax=Tanacetum cinerariifolium TaxID=118510 RepID=A0A6L2JCK2_TANCI|nr:pentatricopeptide repeat-containing protein [Tanacetum cinerariifolium]
MFIEFVIQNQFFSYSLEEFAQILDIPCEDACVFTKKWSLDELAYGVPTDGPYQTNPPSLDDTISSIQINPECQVRCIRHEEEINVLEYQILTREIVPTLKPLEEIFQENIFCLGERKTRKDHGMRRGRHSISSSTFNQPSSSHLNDDDDDDDDDGNDEGTSHASIPSLIRSAENQENWKTFLPSENAPINIGWPPDISGTAIDEDVTTTPSPTTTFSSPTPPNAPSKTTSTNQTSSSQENTSSSFQSKLQISPPSSNELTSPHLLNPLLDNILDVPPRPLNPQLLQSHPSLDITLFLSPITPLDHIHDTLSPPSPPQPQPSIMGHLLYYNYHGSNCICCFHNQTLFLTLRDEMDIMFAHLEYLLTTAITSHFPPLP